MTRARASQPPRARPTRDPERMPRTVRTLAVEYRLLSAIRGATRNPKGHDLPAIGASFDRFGHTGRTPLRNGRPRRIR